MEYKNLNIDELINLLNDTYYNYERFYFYFSEDEIKQYQKEIRSLKYYIKKVSNDTSRK